MYRFIFTLALLLLLVSCSEEEIINNGEGTNEEESTELIFSEDYVSIDWEQAKLTGYDEQTGMVELTYKDPSSIPNLTNGKVFVALSEDRSICSIRIVESMRKEGNTVKMSTERGCLADVFEDAHFTLMIGNATPQSNINVFYPSEYIETDSITGKNKVTRASSGIKYSSINPKVIINESFTVQDKNGRGSISVSPEGVFEAELSYGAEFNFKPNLNDAIDVFYRSKTGKAKFYASGTVSVSLGAGIEGNSNIFSAKEEEVIMYNCLKSPVKVIFYLGVPPTVVPVLFEVNADLVRELTASLSGSISANIGVKTQASITCGAEYNQKENKVTPIPPQLDIKSIPSFTPQISKSLNGKIEWCIYPRIKTALYNFVGPVLDVKPSIGNSISLSVSNTIHNKNLSLTMQHILYAALQVGAKLHFNIIDKWIPDVELVQSKRLQINILKIPGKIEAYTNTRVQPGESLFMVYDSICNEKAIRPTSTTMDLLIYDTNKKEYIIGHTDKEGIVHFPYSSNDDKDNLLTATIYNGEGKPIDSAEQIISQAVYIPDAEFRKCLYYNGLAEPYYDASGLVKIRPRDREDYLSITPGHDYNVNKITSLEGIEYILNDKYLLDLDIDGATNLKNLNLRGKNGLKNISIHNVNMNELDLSKSSTIQNISLGDANISSINLSDIRSLNEVQLDINGKTLDLSKCPMITQIVAPNIQNINLSHCTSLTTFYSNARNNIESINLTNCTALNSLSCGSCKNLHTLIIDECSNLNSIDVKECNLSNIDCANLQKLERIDISLCPITALNTNGCKALRDVYINGIEDASENASRISSLDLSSSKNLTTVSIYNNQTPLNVNIGSQPNLDLLVITNSHLKDILLGYCPQLRTIDLTSNDLTQFTIPNQQLTMLKLLDNPIKQVLPDYFDRAIITYCFLEWRYTNYEYDQNGKLHYTDNGVGWWYPFEPEQPRW